ncbi:MAG: IseA DL-endopeptidase inhibitor family protein [Actinomycetia bacterium]|nr:IseA DL-endopeptidase inhibitor family protein [Actinomycetes bacterium]
MKRLWMTITLIALLSLIFAGCNVGQISSKISDKDYISETLILFLAQNAVAHFWHVSSGGKIIYPEEGYLETFYNNDIEYRYFGEDLDSMEKLYRYLGEVYSEESIDEYVKLANIIEFEGKLAQPNADGGDLRMWEAAKIIEIDEKDNKKVCMLEVPYPENVAEAELVIVTIEQTKGKNWVVFNIPGSF